MLSQKQAEEAIVSSYNETENDGSREGANSKEDQTMFSVKNFLWHGGSVYDAWFSCASNQVAQVLLTLPYSFSQLGMLSGIIFQLFYGIMGSRTAYLISVLYIEYRTKKEKENANFKNHVIQWFEVLHGFLTGNQLDWLSIVYFSSLVQSFNLSLVQGYTGIRSLLSSKASCYHSCHGAIALQAAARWY